LVITLEAATLTKEGAWATEGSSAIFHSSMIELGLLGLLTRSRRCGFPSTADSEDFEANSQVRSRCATASRKLELQRP
jgi:hypothetical protein